MRTLKLAAVASAIALGAASAQYAGETATPCPPPGLLDPADYGDAGPGYPPPQLTVRCSGDLIVFESNGVPSFAPERKTPNRLAVSRWSFKVPRAPRKAAQPSEVPILGPIAVTVTGLPIFAPNEAADLGYGDAHLDGILDRCGGHVSPRGHYHFHIRPACPFEQIKDLTELVLGYGFDGYPIMAPYVCANSACSSLRRLTSSWRLVDANIKAAWDKHRYVEGAGDLDRCNGRIGNDGRYRYYATDGFPYTLGCYRGVVDRRLNNLQGGWSARSQIGAADRGQRRGTGRPDLDRAAAILGVTPQRLKRALGPPPPNLRTAARALGVSERRLREALRAAQ